MLKLICTVKCGYEKLFICEKDVEIPLDFLTNKDLYAKIFQGTALDSILSAEEIFKTYAAKPDEFINKYNIK